MKTKVITKQEFKPIVIELTIESEEELCDLSKRLGIDAKVVDSSSLQDLKYNSDNNSAINLYFEIRSLVKKYNLDK